MINQLLILKKTKKNDMKNLFITLFIFCSSVQLDAQQNTDSLNKLSVVLNDTTALNETTDSAAHYATLYVYRVRNFVGSMVGYKLHVNDSDVCKIKNNSKYAIKLYKEGITEIWAKTEKKASVKIDVKFGKEYYVRCGLTTGIFAGRPQLNMIAPEQGKLDFDNVEGRDNDAA